MFLYGASGHGKVIKEIIETTGGQVESFIDDDQNLHEYCGLPVLHDVAPHDLTIVSIGENSIRKKVVNKLSCDFGVAIHPTAIVSPSAKIGEGTVIMAGAIINADSVIGKHCIINTGASVDHECVVGDFCHVAPHATLCGQVHIDEGTLVGVGASVIPRIHIGKWCTIGGGAAVTHNLESYTKAVGVPATRVLSRMYSTEKHNILITSAGKRVALVNEFKETLQRFFPGSKVFITDMNPELAPVSYVCDGSFKVPKVTSKAYPNILLQICENNNVGLVIPTIDTELILLANLKDEFEKCGIYIMVSEIPFLSICRDKRNTGTFFERHGIKVPKEIDISNPTFPIFAKPYDGSLSTNLHYIKSSEELTSEIMNDSKLLFMEYIDKDVFQEFTIDMYYGKDHKLKCVVPRERIEIRAGEINKGRTSKNEIVDVIKEKLDYIDGCVGCICMQLFFHPETKEMIGIEINPRFGGGYPLTYACGGNYPELLIREYFLKEKINYFDNWKDGMLMLRYDDAIFV